jgi:hypothetical protein
MNKPKKQPCRKRNGKQVSFDFKLSVIDEINNGRISVNYACGQTSKQGESNAMGKGLHTLRDV